MKKAWIIAVWRVFQNFCVFCTLFAIVFLLFWFFTGQFGSYDERPPVISSNSETELLNVPNDVQRASKSVVLIRTERVRSDIALHLFQARELSGYGSGFIISSHYVLTAFHVVKPAFGVSAQEYLPVVITVEQDETIYRARPIAFDAVFDLALLEIEENLSMCAVISSSVVFDYEDVYVIGYFSKDKENPETPSKYIYKKHHKSENSKDIIFDQTWFIINVEAPNFSGFSGGPVLNPEGQVAGIATRMYDGFGQGYQLRGTSAPLIEKFLKAINIKTWNEK